MSTYFDLIMIPLQLLIVFFTIYYFTLSFFGLFGRRPEEKIYDEQKTFAMIVCAHNESKLSVNWSRICICSIILIIYMIFL